MELKLIVPTLEGDIGFRVVNSSKADRSSSTTKAIETRWPSTSCPTLAAAMPHPDFDAFTRAPTSSKSSRPTGASATSRKNKLQRCSICGGLGHKSRTCDQSDQKRGAGLLSSLLQAEIEMDRCSSPDHRRLAADGLLTLSNEALWTGLTTPVAAESHLFGHHWPATSSPRMMEAGA